MSYGIHDQLRDLREALADIMLKALKENGGIYLSEQDYYKLREKLADALMGTVTL